MSDNERPEEGPDQSPLTPPTPPSPPPPAPEATPPPPVFSPPSAAPQPPPPVPPAPPATPAPPADAGLAPTEPTPAQRPARWVGLVTSLGLAMAIVVTAQTLVAIAEGFALKKTEPQGLPGDIFHRLGYALSRLDATTLLFLVVAVVLVSLPVIVGSRTSAGHETVAAITLGLTVVISVVIGVGSILAVRYNLHLYSASSRPVPTYVRIQLVLYLVGVLGTGAIALFGALTALGLRDRGDRDASEPEPMAAAAS